jgi:2-aminoadipate transaminase
MDLSEVYDFLVVADEVYHLLDYTQPPPLPLAGYIHRGRVLSIGSFSKILGPGLRLGWVQAAPALLQILAESGLVDSGGGLNPFTSNLVRIVLKEGWQDSHLAKLKRLYQKRLQVMGEAIAHSLGDAAVFTMPEGGFFFWLALEEGVDTADLLSAAREHQVGFQPGIRFSSKQDLNNCMRLSFAYYHEVEIEKGMERLAEVLAGR